MRNQITTLAGAVMVVGFSINSVAAGHGYTLTETTNATSAGSNHVQISQRGVGVMMTDYRESVAPAAGSDRIHVAELTWQPGAGPASVVASGGMICEMTAGELSLLDSGIARKVEAGDVWLCAQDHVQAAENHGPEAAVLRILLTVQ